MSSPQLRSIQLQHLPPDSVAVHIALYCDVQNAFNLRAQLLGGNPEFEYAFVDAATIVSTAHILAAVHQAIHNHLITQKLRTRNVHSEVVFSLSPNNNITESFCRFGVTDATSSLLCIKISTPAAPVGADAVSKHLTEIVKGTPVEFNDEAFWNGVVDWGRLSKNYKLGGKIKEKNLANAREVELEVLGKMVMRVVG